MTEGYKEGEHEGNVENKSSYEKPNFLDELKAR